MKQGLTELVFILDRSGSMCNLASDTIGGFNSMIEQQKNNEGNVYVTTVLFNSVSYILHDHIDINSIPKMTEYSTYGMTALNDSVGMTIDKIGKRLYETPENERPEKVIFVIVTDGIENASKEYSRKVVKEMIEHQQKKYNWTFMFIGANMDAVEEGATLGIANSYSKGYTASCEGTESVYRGVSGAVSTIISMDAATYSNLQNEDSVEAKAVACILNDIK